MKPKGICFFNSNRPWGGGEKWHLDFAQLTLERGYRVFAVTNEPSELAARLARLDKVKVLQTGISNLSFLNPFKLLKLARFFKKNKVDVVVMALPSDVKAGGLAARLAGVREIIFRRGIGVPTKNTLLNRFLFKKVITKLICNSENTKRTVLANNPDLIEDSRIFLVHCGFDVREFDELPGSPAVQRRPDEVLIGNAGRLTEQKGQKYLIEAARILKDKGLGFRVLIAGTGELEGPLKALARDLDVEDVVEFLGFVSDMKGFHQTLDIFALPSLWEGFCYAQVEAMTLKRPVVAFEVSSIPEVVRDNETGYLVAAGDARAFAERLERLVRDPELRRRLGENGRQRVIDNFEIHKTLDDFERVIQAG
ncbi:MAG: glycosyltransferase [Desulfovibrionaceae bacterium]|nr:glycosyltransferase [Desulfovibrionaceae bacterium]